MATIRTAAGTRSMGDLAKLRWFSSSTSDLEALDGGATLGISAIDLTHGERVQGRLLVVTRPRTELSWQLFTPFKGYGDVFALPAPYAWVSEDGRPIGMKSTFRQVTLEVGGRHRSFGLSYRDIPTLQTVLAETG
jgi:hypothetical protein